MIEVWENYEVTRCVNTGRPLTHSLDLGEEGLAMQATRICSITDCDRPHFGKGLCQRHLERRRRDDLLNGAAGICSINSCDDVVMSRGWCEGHYRRWLEHGDPTAGRRSPVGGPCSIEDCDRPSKARGWCKLHYYRWKRTGQLELAPAEVRTCSIEACGRPHSSLGWCQLHYQRWKRTGDPLTILPSSRDLRGPLSPNWHGRNLTYAGAHIRTRLVRGKARNQQCVDCGKRALHWSYDHADPDELVEPVEQGGKHYSADPAHYQPRCIRCHVLFDKRAKGTVRK